jgi:hypothetical protein
VWSSTHSELICAFRGAEANRKREHDLAVFVAWRTATLTRARKVPTLTRLLRTRKRMSAAEQEAIRADIAAAEAEFARLDAAARKG